jgi:hypothetical protein
MFHVTNFTESSESHMSLEKLVKTSMTLWERLPIWEIDPKNVSADDLSYVAVKLATMVYEDRFQRPIRKTTEMGKDELSVFMLNAVCTNWFGLWALNAFPRVQMSHSFAAMLLATTISPKELPHVEAPWPAFLIEVPDGLLPLRGKDGAVSHITRIHVVNHLLPTELPERWWGFWMSGVSIEVVKAGTLADAVIPSTAKALEGRTLLKMPDRPRVDVRDMPLEEVDEFWDGYDLGQEDRVSVLIGRLVTGVCTLMTERANYTERLVRMEPNLAKHAKRAGKQPETRIYTVGRPVKLDFRLVLKQYIEGTRLSKSPLTVQRLVAGHHKWQPHGPGNTQRKWIFIHPYWQGPETASIVVRPHVGKAE